MNRFSPPPAVGREAAERHYVEAHHPFMRRMFREHGEHVRRYVSNVALAQYDIGGGFREQPSAWRFVITEVDDPAAFLPEHFQALIWEDHRKCLQDIDAWEVEETVVVDRRSGQTGLVKYLFLHQAEPPPALGALFAAAYGARLYLSNRVLREAATTDEHGPGAAYSGGYRDTAQLAALDELWFDNAAWAEEFFASEPVLGLLRDSPLGRVEGYRVAEAIGVDKT